MPRNQEPKRYAGCSTGARALSHRHLVLATIGLIAGLSGCPAARHWLHGRGHHGSQHPHPGPVAGQGSSELDAGSPEPVEDAGESDAGSAQPGDDAGEPACIPDCDGRECGDDGCDDSCGTCAPNQTCTPEGQCACVPSCDGKACGDDDCDGSCGECEAGSQCDPELGACLPDISFAAVFAIFEQLQCGVCHTGPNPPQGLNLADADSAYAQLVNVASRQCGMMNRMRVAPGAPDDSYLINKLTGLAMCGGQQMPRPLPGTPSSEPRITPSPDQIDRVRAWIAAGAAR
jgi:hypothetical protein